MKSQYFVFDEVHLIDCNNNVLYSNLKAALQKKYEKDVALTSRTDASLIGGAVIRAGDMVVDGSVRGRLTKLVETLLQK